MLKRCLSWGIGGIFIEYLGNDRTQLAITTHSCTRRPCGQSNRLLELVLCVTVADYPGEDGPRLDPLLIAKSRGENRRRFPCKHIAVELGLEGFDILYRLWALPYHFLTRIVCATASVIVRKRRGPQVRIENSAAPRSGCMHLHASLSRTTRYLHTHYCVTFVKVVIFMEC